MEYVHQRRWHMSLPIGGQKSYQDTTDDFLSLFKIFNKGEQCRAEKIGDKKLLRRRMNQLARDRVKFQQGCKPLVSRISTPFSSYTHVTDQGRHVIDDHRGRETRSGQGDSRKSMFASVVENVYDDCYDYYLSDNEYEDGQLDSPQKKIEIEPTYQPCPTVQEIIQQRAARSRSTLMRKVFKKKPKVIPKVSEIKKQEEKLSQEDCLRKKRIERVRKKKALLKENVYDDCYDYYLSDNEYEDGQLDSPQKKIEIEPTYQPCPTVQEIIQQRAARSRSILMRKVFKKKPKVIPKVSEIKVETPPADRSSDTSTEDIDFSLHLLQKQEEKLSQEDCLRKKRIERVRKKKALLKLSAPVKIIENPREIYQEAPRCCTCQSVIRPVHSFVTKIHQFNPDKRYLQAYLKTEDLQTKASESTRKLAYDGLVYLKQTTKRNPSRLINIERNEQVSIGVQCDMSCTSEVEPSASESLEFLNGSKVIDDSSLTLVT